jgi:DNA repair exonuclease SbcCD nuclease subunit
MKYTGYVISDIHIGSKNIENLYEEYKKIFIENLKKDNVDFVIICGDYFDHKLFLNEKDSAYAYAMMVDIIEATNKDTKIRLVYGTESHECNQYEIISKLSTIYNRDIKVIKYVTDEFLYQDLHILYLPEEHLHNKDEYYSKYFENDKTYDYIFGHGVIREAMKEAATQIETQSKKRKTVPVFSTAELRRICKGETYFGHYHVNCDMDDVFYVGSFSRWQFGEEEAKGFYKITCDTKKNKYKHEFIENTMSPIYKTISFGYDNKVFESHDDMEKSLNRIDDIFKDNILDHVRFVFNIPSNYEDPEFLILYLKERYKFNNNVKLEITNGYIDMKRKQQKEEVKKENDKYSFIFDRSMSLEDKTSYFIKIEYNRDIPSDIISAYLYKPLEDILKEIKEGN